MLYVINDAHLGVLRSAGTTPASALQLRHLLLDDFAVLLNRHVKENDLLINGDLFDKGSVPFSDLLVTYKALSDWLAGSFDRKLWLSPGNHDLEKNSSAYSGFQFLSQLLVQLAPTRVKYIADLTEIRPGVWVLPHLPNQDRFDAALAQVPECDVLFVHVNYNNGFAAQSDQSLNMTEEQAKACKARYIVFGHEHQRHLALSGKVLVPGSQLVTSVSDCLGDLDRYMVVLDDENRPSMQVCAKASFAQMDWRELVPSEARFIRVTGQAQPAEGADVAQKISRYRSQSKALVITNAVDMLNDEGQVEKFVTSLEAIRSFDVLDELKKHLTAEEQKAIDELPE